MSELPEWDDLEPGVKFRFRNWSLLVRDRHRDLVECYSIHPEGNLIFLLKREYYDDWRDDPTAFEITRACRIMGRLARSTGASMQEAIAALSILASPTTDNPPTTTNPAQTNPARPAARRRPS